MLNYNYEAEMINDIKSYLEDEKELYAGLDREELEEKLCYDLWVEDSVTGNASGSYTFCSATAKEYVTENIELCKDALEEFCVESSTIADKFLNEDWEYFDVTIRCYLLGHCISVALDETEENE